MTKRGRRPGATQTRKEIVEVARSQFTERGYTKTTIRSIAEAAGVHPALLHHYFGTKQRLYSEVLDLPVNPGEVLARLLDETPPDRFAEAIARHFVSTWRDPQTGAWMRAMTQQTMSNPEGIALTKSHVESLVIPRIAKALNVPEANAAAGFASLLGITLVDSLFGVGQLSQLSEDSLIARIVPILERALHPEA